jgi:hypothetical protein
MFSILTRRLLGSLSFGNPWIILAILGALAASHSFVAYKSFGLGGNAAKVECEKRVKKLQDAVDEQNKQIAALNEKWANAITAVQDAYNKNVADQQEKEQELEKRIADYEATIGASTDCTISRGDVDRVRRKQ